jgi:phenylpyruvate tautomerase PptA (4-oxalocrotonate tautomerase family)
MNMPVVRVELPPGFSDEKKARTRQAVKAAVLKTLAPKEARYDYVAIREVWGEIGDGVPVVTVDLRPGREEERKAALAESIAESLEAVLGIKGQDVYVLFRETAAGNHYCGGKPLPEWVPADSR